jgi:hypothetical protein
MEGSFYRTGMPLLLVVLPVPETFSVIIDLLAPSLCVVRGDGSGRYALSAGVISLLKTLLCAPPYGLSYGHV